MIELVNVSKYYTSNGVTNKGLININLSLNKGEIVAITGESGSGKSTLLNVITKVDSFDEGEIYYKGNETSYFSIDDMDQFRKDKIGFIFQNYNIIDSYTVLENVMLPLIINGSSKKDARAEAEGILEKVGLKARMKNRGSQLSGGEKQRCVIARALASKCEILACDEPTGNLDSQTGAEIIKLLKEVASDKLVLIVTHNFEQVKDIATRKIKVEDGEIIEDLFIDKSTKELEDPKEELDLDYKPISKKTNFRISLNNLTSTPRKTFLIGLILLFTCVIVLYLYQGISVAFNDSTDNGTFPYVGDDKILVSKYDHSAFTTEEIESISDTYYTNEFYYESHVGYFNFSNDYNWDYTYSACYEPNPKDYNIVYGVKPSDTYECMILFNSSYWTKSELKFMCNNTFYLYNSLDGDNKYLVTGVAYCDSLNTSDPVICYNDTIHSMVKLNGMIKATKSTSEYSVETVAYNFDLTTTSSLSVSSDSLNYVLYYYNNVMKDCSSIKTIDTTISYPVLTIGYDFFDDVTAYEVACYGNKKKMKKAAKALDCYVIDCKTYTTLTRLEIVLNHIEEYATMIGSSLVLIIVYFISYAILAVVFKSKSESYNIFRTLGVTKKDMKYIVRYETMISVIATSILAYILARILALVIDHPAVTLFKDISLFVTALYFAVMCLLGLFLAKRFNYRLFHFTVREGLKQVK
ncbi:MAG: ABC transporter ATP-binding protein [Acholeplasmatales bacterium]|nr:ABC transporter ATP-binding protein [Acholeplasmatales bacterium]